jgi:hypothetical protein
MPTPLSPAVIRALRLPRWTASDARLVLDAVHASGLTCAAFARAHPVDYQRLNTWRHRLATPPTTPPRIVPFVEVPAPPPAPRYEVQLASGDLVRIEGAIDPDSLHTLLTVLRARPTC